MSTAEVARVLDDLRRLALVWPQGGTTLMLSPGIVEILPTPLGLGSPLSVLLPMLTVSQLGAIGRELGTSPVQGKAKIIKQVSERLSDPVSMRQLLAGAPAGCAELLAQAAWSRPGSGWAMPKVRCTDLRWGQIHHAGGVGHGARPADRRGL